MEGDGPGTSGKLRDTGLILASGDCVAMDCVLAKIMGINPYDVLTTKEASKRKLGTADINSIEILGENLRDCIGRGFLLPRSSLHSLFKNMLPEPVMRLAASLLRFYPCIDQGNCIRCAFCINACPKKTMRMEKGHVVIDYSGCISCFCCQEACPASVISIRKSILAKLLKL